MDNKRDCRKRKAASQPLRRSTRRACGGGGGGLITVPADPFAAMRAEVAKAAAAVAAREKRAKKAKKPLQRKLRDAHNALRAATEKVDGAVNEARQRQAAASAALARAFDEADPDDLPAFGPTALRVAARFPWKLVLQFAAARDLGRGLARAHRASAAVCRSAATCARVVGARHRRGCERTARGCACPGCARVALLLRAADTMADRGCLPPEKGKLYNNTLRTKPLPLRVLDYTEGAAVGRLPVVRIGRVPAGWRGYGAGDAADDLSKHDTRGTGNDQFHTPEGLAVDPGPGGHVYVADSGLHRVQVYSKTGDYIRTFGVTGETGSDNKHFETPIAVAVDRGPDGHVYVADTDNHRVVVLTKEGGFVRSFGVAQESGNDDNHFHFPCGVAVEPGADGHVYVLDVENHRVVVLTKQGAFVRARHASGLSVALAIEPGADGDVYTADNRKIRVRNKAAEADEAVHPLRSLSLSNRTESMFGPPGMDECISEGRANGLAIEPGPNGLMYVSDIDNGRIEALTKAGAHVRFYTHTGIPDVHNISRTMERSVDFGLGASGVAVEPGADGLICMVDGCDGRAFDAEKEEAEERHRKHLQDRHEDGSDDYWYSPRLLEMAPPCPRVLLYLKPPRRIPDEAPPPEGDAVEQPAAAAAGGGGNGGGDGGGGGGGGGNGAAPDA